MKRINQRQIHYRVSPLPRLRLPFGARSVGYYEISPNQLVDEPKIKQFIQIFWIAFGSVLFKYKQRPLLVTANQIFLYPTGSQHHVTSGPEGCAYHWLTLDGPLAGAVVNSFGLEAPWPKNAGAVSIALFKQLAEELQDIGLAAERLAATTAYRLLTSIAEGCTHPTAVVPETLSRSEKARVIFQTRLEDASLGIETLSRELDVDRSVFCRQFKQAFGLSPKQYLTSLRVHRAMSLLKETDLPVRVIAERTGFEDANYFMRAFRRESGLTPSQFRLN